MPVVRDQKLHQLRSQTDCDLRTDALTRLLYATDASIYQIEPTAVAFPRTVEEVRAVIQASAAEDLPITARGAGTGLAGGAVGNGLIIDFSKHNRRIWDLNVDARTVRVEAGVVLDQLNAYLHPHGLRFGPDVATSSRATLGGMINNNSSGSHVPLYGTTVESIHALDVVLANGTVATIGQGHDGLSNIQATVTDLIQSNLATIEDRMPPGLLKRWAGYGVDRWLRNRADLTRIISGSEGTLAVVTSAQLELQPLPEAKGLGIIAFATVAEAMQATVELLELEPAAIEHIDDVLFDQTLGQIQFKKARALLELDEKPCKAILLVEFFSDVPEKLAALEAKNIGLRTSTFLDESDQNHIWGLRKSGLSLLTGCKGAAKPTAGIEDVAILPEKLPDYVEGLQSLMKPLGLSGSFYGHAASGLLHVRPTVDLHQAEDVEKYRQLAEGVSALTKQFKGSIAGEHGVGIARTEFLPDHLGPELMGLFGHIKDLFDPDNLLNPGKILPAKPERELKYTIDTHLRQGDGSSIDLPFEATLAFASKDESFIGNLEQCNGCGGCRKDGPTMCPTFRATGDEIMSTRGRANTIRAALEHSHGVHDASIFTPELEEALSNCLSCRACTTECPSNVNMSLLKAELLHARHQVEGIPLRDRLIARVGAVGKIASNAPGLANLFLGNSLIRKLNETLFGLSSRRPFPQYAKQDFNSWFDQHQQEGSFKNGSVYLWDDSFSRYNEPHVARTAVRVLNTFGYQVELLTQRTCCGRPAFSTGQLDLARSYAEKNVRVIADAIPDLPIIFLEPSCHSMFKEDYRELGIADIDTIETRCSLIEDFLLRVLNDASPDWKSDLPPMALHTHCHTDSMSDTNATLELLRSIPDAHVTEIKTGCCGMAGAFGSLKDKYELSVKIAEPLIDCIDALDPGTVVVASGTSCRHQIEHLSSARPRHLIEVLADSLADPK
ncbi:MAG: FAD-linked oxidase C-terminal domain-containing protein [Candidatus Hydrogenedentota bacterium]